MKTRKIRLNKLVENGLAHREIKELKGGAMCRCACRYEDNGGSSTDDNGMANNAGGYRSPGGGRTYLDTVECEAKR